MRPAPIVLASLALALVAGACSSDDNASGGGGQGGGDASRTIEIDMRDNAYSPDTVTVEDGETVRFVFTNTGEATHDAFIGDEAAQDDHEMEMNEHGGHGDDSGAVSVESGETGELTHTFDAGDEMLIGCHEPGHYDAGMRIAVDVT